MNRNSNSLKNVGPAVKRLLLYSRKYRLQFISALALTVIASLSSLISPLFQKHLIDDFIVPMTGSENPAFTKLLHIVLFFGGLFYFCTFCGYLQKRLMIIVSQGIQRDIRDDLFLKMQHLPVKYFDSRTHGDIMSIYTNDVDTLRQLLGESIPQIFNAIVTLTSTVAMMVVLSVPLTLLSLAIIAFMLFLIRKIGGKSTRYFTEQQKNTGTLNGFVEEMTGGEKTIKAFSREKKIGEKFDALNDRLCQSSTKANEYANIMMPVMGNLSNIQYVLTAIVGSALSISGVSVLSLGSLISFLQLCKTFSRPVAMVGQQTNAIALAIAGAGRIFSLIDEEPETDEGTVRLAADGTAGDVDFKHVTFGYSAGKTVLHDITIDSNPGQKVAFVGSTGAGKTTIMNLLTRFYDTVEGTITYNGTDIREIRKSDLRHSMGMVLQDTHLFTGSIMENIRYGRLNATDDEVRAAAELAHADRFINLLADGYDTLLTNDGSELSQGECQLISIARAAIADTPVLILDEATSSIDTRTERLIQKGLDALMKGRTVFVIAHRLSTVRDADNILVLENGRITERGTDRELLALRGTYWRLSTGALELD